VSSEEQCKVPGDSCSRGGTGPTCSQNPEIGAANKKECLEEAKEYCEEALKKCIEECDKEKEEGLATGMDGQTSLIDGIFTPSEAYENSDSIQRTNIYGYGDSSYFRGPTPDGNRDFHNILADHTLCMRDCYYQAASDCSTVQCYCNSLKCDVDSGPPGGDGGRGEDEFDRVYKTDRLGEVEFSTNSQYGGLIELVYTRAYMPGNIIWISDVYPDRKETTYSTTDPETKTITIRTAVSISNKVAMHIGLCAGEISDIMSIRVDGSLLYDRNDPSYAAFEDTFELMRGARTQKARQAIAEEFGFGRAPAFRGLSYLVLGDFELSGFTQFPKFSIEVVKSAKRETANFDGAAIPGKDSAIVWTVSPEAKRAYAESSGGVMCLDTDSLTQVWDKPVANPIEVTPLGRVVTYDGVNIGVYDSAFEQTYGSYLASLPISQSFMFRTPDMTGNSSLTLITQSGDGNAIAEEIGEVIPQFPADSVSIRELSGLDTDVHDVAVESYNYTAQAAGISAFQRSIYLLRVHAGTFDTIRVRELRLIGAASDFLLENEEWYEYDLPLLTFNNSHSLVLLGAIPHASGGFVVFTVDNAGYRAVYWKNDAVQWSETITAAPGFGKYAPVDVPVSNYFFYIYGSTVYRLNVNTGEQAAWPLTSIPASLDGKQFYFSKAKTIFYESAGGKLSKIVLEQFSTTNETVGDVARDLTARLGLSVTDFDYTDIDTIEVTGFRSGSYQTAAEIMQALADIYQFTFSANERISFSALSTDTAIIIDANDVLTESPLSRTSVNKEDRTVRVSYFSVPLFGEIVDQTFTFDHTAERTLFGADATYSWPVLETDLFMRQLAERLAYKGEQTSRGQTLTLPPRYLSLTPGDTLVMDPINRAHRVTVGADLTIELEIEEDDPSKYSEEVPLSAQEVISRRRSIDETTLTLGGPMAVSTRGIFPVRVQSSCVYAGVSNIDEAYDAPTTIAPTNSMIDYVPSGPVLKTYNSMMWGRLSALPATHPTARFKTFVDDSLKIVFADQEMADRVLQKVSHYGKVPDRRTVDPYYNTLVVGKEIIQYGYAVGQVGVSKEVTFNNLIRNLHLTEQFADQHVIGEVCVVVDPATCADYEVSAENLGQTFKLFTYARGTDRRRFDAYVEEDVLLPIDPGYVMRLDRLSAFTVNASFGARDTLVYFRMRNGRNSGFDVDSADQGLSTYDMLGNKSIYLLRADYDEALFDAERYGTSRDYIFARSDPIFVRQDVGSRERYYLTSGWEFTYGSPTTYEVIWDDLTEPLVVVLITTNEYGETRAVYKFPPGDYTDRPTRGLRVL